MAQTNNTTFSKLVLVLTLLFFISISESRNLIENKDSSVVCNSVHGQESGETCTTVAEEFNLSLEQFLEINPNINCDDVYVGQWLCIDGSA